MCFRRPFAVARLFVAGALIGLSVFSFSGCALFAQTDGPMQTRLHPHPQTTSAGFPSAEPSKRVLVLLPGRGDEFGVFDKHRFIRLVQQETDFDVLEVDAHLAYYMNKSIIGRMSSEVIAPLKARGYREIWLAGISLGGLGGIFTAQAHPRDISGIILMSPYLGDPPIFNQIERAGGLLKWQPGPIAPNTFQKRIWAWLKERVRQNDLPIWLAYGEKDYMSDGHRLLDAALPVDRVIRDPGAHNWTTWEKLWPSIVAAAWTPPDAAYRYALQKETAAPTQTQSYVQR